MKYNRRAGYEVHGMSNTPEYRAWADMIQRCVNEECPNYPNYGGRGINVCPGWASSFSNFIAHVGMRPSKKHSIERINNDMGYFPGNVKWATKPEQCANRRVFGNSKYKGVSYREKYGRWRAYEPKTGKHIGNFGSEIDAMLAYNRYACMKGLPINPIPTMVACDES